MNSTSQFKKPTRKKRKVSVELKESVIRKHTAGLKIMEISRSLVLPESTVRNIIKSKEKIQLATTSVQQPIKKNICYSRNVVIQTTETMMYTWIIDQRRKGVPLDTSTITCKARSLFDDVKSRQGADESLGHGFSAGWFARFKKRYNLRNIRLHGEARRADNEAASNFKEYLMELVGDGEYSSKQIYNADESSLFWKKLPSRSFVPEEENQRTGFKMHKDRVTLLFAGNAYGAKLKPLLIHRSKKPRALKGSNTETLPVIWRHNKKAWMTRVEFVEWFSNYFVPFVRDYNEEHNLHNKALLILDNFAGHPTNICDMYPHIRVVFLPPKTTSIMQPMDQGIIASFKAMYLRATVKHLVAHLSENLDIHSYCKEFNIKNALHAIDAAWSEISSSTMQNAWKRLLPYSVLNDNGIDDSLEICNSETVDLMHQAGFENIEARDIDEFLSTNDDEMTNDELLQIDHTVLTDDEEIVTNQITECVEEEVPRAQDLEIRKKMFDAAEELKRLAGLVEKDPKRRTFHLGIDALMSPYQ